MRKILFFFICFFVQKNILGQRIKFDTRNATYVFVKDYTSIESVRLFSVIDSAIKYLPCESLPNGSNKMEAREVRVIPTSREREFLYNQSYFFGKRGDTAFFREEFMTGSFPRFQNADFKVLKNMISDFIEKLILEARLIKETMSPENIN